MRQARWNFVIAVTGGGLLTMAAGLSALAAPPGGGGNQDLSVCITMDESAGLASDGLGAYCDSTSKIDAFVGRNRGIMLELGVNPNQTRRFILTFGSHLPDVAGDPDPNADGGIINQSTPGDWSGHPLPTIPPEGLTGEFFVGGLVNVLKMGEPGQQPNPNEVTGRLRWGDGGNGIWSLHWGPDLLPGGFQATNPDAPSVLVVRSEDGSGLINEWTAVTQGDTAPARLDAATAFLWHQVSPSGPRDYYGAFDISFEYVAEEE